LADVDVHVLASGAFSAIETAMQAYQIEYVAYAAADLVGGLLHYRGYKVRVVLDPYVVLEALSWVSLDLELPVRGADPLACERVYCVLAGVSGVLVGTACYPCFVEVR
jgi:hypothetical protein